MYSLYSNFTSCHNNFFFFFFWEGVVCFLYTESYIAFNFHFSFAYVKLKSFFNFSLSLWETWAVLKYTGQLLCRTFPTMGWYVSSWLYSGYAYLAECHRNGIVSSTYHIKRYLMSLRLIVGDVLFDHLGKVFTRVLYCKDTFIDLAI